MHFLKKKNVLIMIYNMLLYQVNFYTQNGNHNSCFFKSIPILFLKILLYSRFCQPTIRDYKLLSKFHCDWSFEEVFVEQFIVGGLVWDIVLTRHKNEVLGRNLVFRRLGAQKYWLAVIRLTDLCLSSEYCMILHATLYTCDRIHVSLISERKFAN